MVEVAAYVVSSEPYAPAAPLFFDLERVSDREDILRAEVLDAGSHTYLVPISVLRDYPGAAITYSLPSELARDFEQLPQVKDIVDVCRGSATSDDARFIRAAWEVPPETIVPSPNRRWRWLSKGGSYGAYYSSIHLVLDWRNEGDYLGSYMYEKRPRNGYLWGPKSWSQEFMGKPGIFWPLVWSGGGSPLPLPLPNRA